jgi:hypothetical protein
MVTPVIPLCPSNKLSDMIRQLSVPWSFALPGDQTQGRKLMRSLQVEFRMPWVLYDLLKQIRTRERYRNMPRLFIGLGINAVLQAQDHSLSRLIANADPSDQDAYLDGLKNARTGSAEQKLSWLEHRICEVAILAQGCTDVGQLKAMLAELVGEQLKTLQN